MPQATRRISAAEKESYWNSRGRFLSQYKKLSERIPASGPCEDSCGKNRHLDRLRRAVNAYNDLFNNGLANRKGDFIDLFGFNPDIRPDGGVVVNGALFRRTEPRMDRFIRLAAIEQGIA